MTEAHSTTPAPSAKPAKPSPDFPLFPHATKRWAKKINGRMCYFGPWDDPHAALRAYQDFLDGKPAAKRSKRPARPAANAKPAKPTPDFPLFPHASGRWAKKIRGKLHYFGPWSDPDAALTRYLDQKDALHSGRKPRPDPEALTLKDIANEFLNHKQAMVDAGELSPRTWLKYKEVCNLLVSQLGKSRPVADLGTDDFAALRRVMARRWGALRIRDVIQHVRSVFKHALESGLMDQPMRFGPGFARPSKKTIRLERAKKGLRMFEADEIRRIIAAAGTPLKVMVLLGINCGFGNADCGTLPLSALDLDGGWVNYHRLKTGINRRCPLWSETVMALREWLANRPTPKDEADAELVFITSRGGRWHKAIEDNPVSKETRKLLHALGINGQRNFYALRHGFETIGGEAKDQVAVDHIMGHARDDMASVYRERISDARLTAVTDHVHEWLFGEPPTNTSLQGGCASAAPPGA
jgi:integrase